VTCAARFQSKKRASLLVSRETPADISNSQPFVRRAAGRRILSGTPFVPTPLSRHGKRRGHRQGEAERSSPLAGLTAQAAPHGIKEPSALNQQFFQRNF